jgi:CHAT domain
MLALVTPHDEQPPSGWRMLMAWPWEQWQRLLGAPGGWIDVLNNRPGADGPSALDQLLREADAGLGQAIAALLAERGVAVRRLAVIPHRWLHLIPLWALPSLSGLAVRTFASAAELVTSRQGGAQPGSEAGCLVVSDPTGDLLVSSSEAESVSRRLGPRMRTEILDRRSASADQIATGLARASFFHFSGHGRSDHVDPDRSALLVAPPADVPLDRDPFQDWVDQATGWRDAPDSWRVTDLAGVGRLYERTAFGSGQVERRLERGRQGTLYASYRAGRLRRFGELWSAGDVLVGREPIACRFAFLSACESGVASGASDIDEYGGLPVALRLGGAETLVCSLWVVSQGFAAIYVDRFYQELSHQSRTADVGGLRAACRRVGVS